MTEFDIITQLEQKIGQKFEKVTNVRKLLFEYAEKETIYAVEKNKIIGIKIKGLDIKEIPHEIAQLKNLIFLSASENKIQNISALKELEQINMLYLSQNEISDISPLTNKQNLKILDLSYNNISNISAITNLKNLVKLFLNNNQISNIEKINKIKNLQELSLSDNKIEKINTITKLWKLTRLDLSNNNINQLPSLSSLENLVELNLSNNQISNIDGIRGMRKLETFKVANNKIKHLPNDFQDVSLKFFILSNNLIEKRSELQKVPPMPLHAFITDNNPVSWKAYLFREPPDAILGIDILNKALTEIISLFKSDKAGMVGIFGRWGRGKTFFWRKLKKDLEDKSYKTVEFSAWKYNDTPASWAYLYETIANALYGKPAIKRPFKILQLRFSREPLTTIFNLFLSIILPIYILIIMIKHPEMMNTKWSIMNGLELKVGLVITYILFLIYYFPKVYNFKLPNILKQISSKRFLDLMGMQAEIEKELTFLIKKYPNKIVLFVDDLDRCSEDRILQIIDSLRIIIENQIISEKLVVIAAVDERILKKVIKNKYKDMVEEHSELEMMVKEYLEKLFAFSIKLPSLSQAQKEAVCDNIKKSVYIYDRILVSEASTGFNNFRNFLLKVDKEITPRQINNVYNRYFFAINLLRENLKKNRKKIDNNDKSLLAALIIHFSFIDKTDNISNYINTNTKFEDKKAFIKIFGTEIEIDKNKINIFVEIIKTTIAH
jgi:Leucine-rich repeat (LRR) protein